MKTPTDLPTLPRGISIPARPSRGGRKLSNIIDISKTDFDYMAERHFKGRFCITNYDRKPSVSARLAALSGRDAANILLKVANISRSTKLADGTTWRTVSLLSAYKTEDGKYCVIEIAPPSTAKWGAL